jgi:predicted DCC family thiol-disulfide oxidoreductase YuxK
VTGPVVLYDGACGLCSRAVRFLLARDPAGHLRFRALADPHTRAWLVARGLGDLPDTMVLLEDGQAHLRSEAVRRACRHLRAPWPWLGGALGLVPRRWRDAAYDAIARRRHRWFAPPTCPLDAALPPARRWQPEAVDGGPLTTAPS